MRPNRQYLDEDSASRLLRGLVHPDDAPPGYGPVAGLLVSAARLQQAAVDEDVAATTVSAMVEAIRDAAPTPQTSRRRAMLGKLLAGKALAAIAVVGLTATGAAAAATGTLPDQVQSAVAGAVSHVGFDLPHPHGKSADHRQDGKDHQDGDGSEAGDDTGQSGDQDKGMSGFVHDTKDANDLPLGPQVCDQASDGKCHGGDANPGQGEGDDESTPSGTAGEGENRGRGHDDGEDAGVEKVKDPAGSIETGKSHSSGRAVGSSGRGNSPSVD